MPHVCIIIVVIIESNSCYFYFYYSIKKNVTVEMMAMTNMVLVKTVLWIVMIQAKNVVATGPYLYILQKVCGNPYSH